MKHVYITFVLIILSIIAAKYFNLSVGECVGVGIADLAAIYFVSVHFDKLNIQSSTDAQSEEDDDEEDDNL